MTASEKFNIVRKACDEKKICELTFKNEITSRVVQPFGICLTFKRGLIIVCKEVSPYNVNVTLRQVIELPLEDCEKIKILERKFAAQDFVQSNKCNDWLFHV
jgi:hypothetical protein